MNVTHCNEETKKFSHVCTRETCAYSSAYFRLVCSKMFFSFLLMGNFDLVNILTHVWCGAPVRPNMFEHSNVSAVNTEGKEIGIG